MADRTTNGGGWWPSDELKFIRELPDFCYSKRMDPILCISGYLNSINNRKDWGRYIREDDIQEFIQEAKNQLKILKINALHC